MRAVAFKLRLVPFTSPSHTGDFDFPQSTLCEAQSFTPNYAGRERSIQMMDVLMIALTFGFFALAIGYAYACERL